MIVLAALGVCTAAAATIPAAAAPDLGGSASSDRAVGNGTGASSDDALLLLPAPVASKQLFLNHSWPSWGGTIVRGIAGDTQHPYHLFAASFANGCGLDGWIRNGVVVHATAPQPAGPYTFHDVALPVFQHNPHAVKHPDGTYLLFGIGQANNASWECPCKDGKPMMPDGQPATDADAAPVNHAQLHVSQSPYGPWENVRGPNDTDYIFEVNNANPAPWIFPNGSLIVVTCQMDVYYAAHYRGAYTKIGTLPMVAMNAARNDSVARQLTKNGTCRLTVEDPYGNFELRHHFGPFFAHFSAQPHPTRTVGRVLLGVQAYLMLIGACNPMLCPIWGFQVHHV